MRRLGGMGLLDSYVSSGIGVGFVCDSAGGSTELLIVFISRANNGRADGYGGPDIDEALQPAIASTLLSFSFRRHVFRCMIMNRLHVGGVVCVYECQHADHLRKG